jgi:hypothetical protein
MEQNGKGRRSARGRAPLYGLLSTKDVRGQRVVLDTKGNTEGFGQITVKVGSDHGGVTITLRENGDCEVGLVRWQSRTLSPKGDPIYHGTKRVLMDGNLRDLEDLYGRDGQGGEQLSLPERQAHQDYADQQ